MKQTVALAVLLLGLLGVAFSVESSVKEAAMTSSGSFEVALTPQEDADFPAGRMFIDKTYSGDMQGSGIGQMISKRTADGAAVYYAIEEFSGILNGKAGSFTLVHKGFMNAESQMLDVSILEGSGGGELQGITGLMIISQRDGGHYYELSYNL